MHGTEKGHKKLLIAQRFLGHRSIQEEMREQKKNEKHATVKPV